MKKIRTIIFIVSLCLVGFFTSCAKSKDDFNEDNSTQNEITNEVEEKENSLNKEEYKVVFYDKDGKTILSECNVEKNETAVPPEAPNKQDLFFLGWEGDYTDITENRSVRAVYSDEKNVFLLSTVNNFEDQVRVRLQLCGIVKTCGFDITVHYDSEALDLISCDDSLDLDIIYNHSGDQILLNYSAATDKTKEKDIIELIFQKKNLQLERTKIYLEMTSIKEIDGVLVKDSNYVLINDIIKI